MSGIEKIEKSEKDEKDVRSAIESITVDGRAACKSLLELSENLSVTPKRVGQICDEMGVRVSGCQLGCFPRRS